MKKRSLIQAAVNKRKELYAKVGMNESDFAQALTMLEIHRRIRSLGSSNW